MKERRGVGTIEIPQPYSQMSDSEPGTIGSSLGQQRQRLATALSQDSGIHFRATRLLLI